MAEHEYYIGSRGPFTYDDTDAYPDTAPHQGLYDPDGPTSANAAKKAWPVNSVMITAVNTNPATLVGIGTWSSLGSGALLSGIADTLYAWKRTA